MCYEKRDTKIALECWERDRGNKKVAEYIEREALSKWLHETMSAQTTTVGMAYVRDFWNKVLDTPAADVAPVVHGRWEVVHGVLTPGGDPLLRCPICKARESEHLCGVECRTVWNYCPNCGARMDGE